MFGSWVLFEGDELELDRFRDVDIELPWRPVLKGSGKLNCNRRRVCIQGDEKEVSLIPKCRYTTRDSVEAGEGTVKIERLGSENLARSTDGGKRILVEGRPFPAVFVVDKPAKLRSGQKEPPIDDPKKSYEGEAKFVSKQKLFAAM